jgi:hypothetical protein
VSEIIGVNAQIGVKTSSRIDPLGMRAAAKVVAACLHSQTRAAVFLLEKIRLLHQNALNYQQ